MQEKREKGQKRQKSEVSDPRCIKKAKVQEEKPDHGENPRGMPTELEGCISDAGEPLTQATPTTMGLRELPLRAHQDPKNRSTDPKPELRLAATDPEEKAEGMEECTKTRPDEAQAPEAHPRHELGTSERGEADPKDTKGNRQELSLIHISEPTRRS